jgi:hypothetical protein
MTFSKEFRNYYYYKKGDARRRNIDFLMTIEELWSLWKPYWEESRLHQSNGYRKYCLSRHGDQGPYELSNCTVQTHSANSKERWQTNRNFKPGKGDVNMRDYIGTPREVSVNGVVYGSAGMVARELGIHNTTAHNRCQSKNFPEWQYTDGR